jgi:Response regulator containing a CheY-like receiver domain and an HTH DNA-binding domain
LKDNNRHIAIVEPSHIIYEGLSNIFLKAKQHYRIYRFESIAELSSSIIKDDFEIIIINPTFLLTNKQEFGSIKKNLQKAFWVGIIYSFFDKKIIDLFDSVIQISDHPDVIENGVNKLLNSDCRAGRSTSSESLTEREKDVLIQLVSGMANKEIADKLNISIHTVVSHRKNITQKTGIKSQSGLTIYAISNKIISLDNNSF